jgi:endonuclease/exonuclease/phosphatase family metal-dependent hydrolase
MEADINGATTPLPGFYQVLEGIGEEDVGGNVRPIDILGLQETTSNTTTVQPILNALNSYYGAGTYAMSSYQATLSDTPDVGSGPNALVYNTKTVQLLESTPVASVGFSGNGVYRQPVRYKFEPVGGTSADDFYMYVDHFKSGGAASDATARNGEAKIIRSNEAGALPSTARVLYVGDYNFGTSTETTYQTMTTLNSPSPNSKAQGRAVDVYNPPDINGNVNYTIDWDNSSNLSKLSDSSTNLRYRDDYQFMTTNVYNGTAGGLAYVSGSYHIFGNNGTVAYHGSASSTGALTNLVLRGDMNQDSKITAADIGPMLSALTDRSGYQSTHSFNSHTLTNADVLAAGDINKDGALTNADLQALLTELQNPGAADAPVTRSTLQSSLTIGSDHYPVVADYTVSVSGGGSSSSVPEPSSLALLGLAGLLTFGRYARQRRAG